MINAAVILRPLRGPTHSEVSIRASVAAWLPTACCLVELQTKVCEDFTIKVVAAFSQEKALFVAFSVITNLRVDLRLKLY